jgi:hypothetical protein
MIKSERSPEFCLRQARARHDSTPSIEITGNNAEFCRDTPKKVASTWAIETSGIHLIQYLLEPHSEYLVSANGSGQQPVSRAPRTSLEDPPLPSWMGKIRQLLDSEEDYDRTARRGSNGGRADSCSEIPRQPSSTLFEYFHTHTCG